MSMRFFDKMLQHCAQCEIVSNDIIKTRPFKKKNVL